jgi:hypothetical protein
MTRHGLMRRIARLYAHEPITIRLQQALSGYSPVGYYDAASAKGPFPSALSVGTPATATP